MATFYWVREEEYAELALGVEFADLAGDVGEIFARRLLADDPRMG
jgi:hypothetical protein